MKLFSHKETIKNGLSTLGASIAGNMPNLKDLTWKISFFSEEELMIFGNDILLQWPSLKSLALLLP